MGCREDRYPESGTGVSVLGSAKMEKGKRRSRDRARFHCICSSGLRGRFFFGLSDGFGAACV